MAQASEETHLVSETPAEETTTAPSDAGEAVNEAQVTNYYNVILWYFFEVSYHFFNVLMNTSTTTTLQLLAFKKYLDVNFGFTTASIVNGIANLIAIFASPILGGISDYFSVRKGALICCVAIYSFCFLMAAICFHYFWAVTFFLFFARLAFEMSRLFYDSQIPYIMGNKNRGFIQTIGTTISFFGSILGSVITFTSVLIWGQNTTAGTLVKGDEEMAEKLNFGNLRQVIFFDFFLTIFLCIPYVFSKEKPVVKEKRPFFATIKEIVLEVLDSFRQFFKDRDCVLFFFGWFCVLSSLGVLNGLLVSILQTMCGLNMMMCILFMFGIFIVAIVSGVPWAWILQRFGPKLCSLVMLVFMVIALVFMVLAGMYVGNGTTLPGWVAVPSALFLGAGVSVAYSCNRQMIMELAPPSQLAKFSAVSKIAARAGSFLVPICYTLLVNLFASVVFEGDLHANNYAYRVCMIPIFFMIVVAFIIICFMHNHHPKYKAGFRAPYPKIKKGELQEIPLVEQSAGEHEDDPAPAEDELEQPEDQLVAAIESENEDAVETQESAVVEL